MEALGPIRGFLAADHDRLEALLTSAVTPQGKLDLASYAQIRAGLLRHIGIEEKIRIYEACDRLLGGELEAVMKQLRSYPPVKVAPHFDGPGVSRSAEDALRAVSPRRTDGGGADNQK